VTTEPEIRTKCTEDESWIVVVTALNGTSTTPNVLEVTDVSEGVCDACLIGQWDLDLESIRAFFQAFSPDQSFDIAGSWTFGFGPSEGGSTASFVEQRALQLYAPEISTSVSVDLIGDGSGTYTADETSLTIGSYINSAAASVGGFTSGPSVFSDDGGSTSYICEDDSLAFSVGMNDFTATRIPETPEGDPYFT